MDPKKGIEYLIENCLLENTCEEIAGFLYKGEGLNKTAIGDYLGERNDFNKQVLDAFVCLHDFTDLILVQALRYVALPESLANCESQYAVWFQACSQFYQCNDIYWCIKFPPSGNADLLNLLDF